MPSHAENLTRLFKPNSVAVIGVGDEPADPGLVVMRNLLAGKFLGPVMPVRADKALVLGQESWADVETLPLTPDLGILAGEPSTWPAAVEELGRRGCQGVLCLSRGRFRKPVHEALAENRALLDAAARQGVRILGPNCLGFINPGIGLNASLAHRDALPGKIAFISQSDALFTTVLDWASSKGIGFSHFISMGDRLDIHLGHILDFLMGDPNTRAVLIYVETIQRARDFMSAARATSRNKPVLVLKSGRSEQGAKAAAAHSGSYLGADDVYDAAFRRAGMLRVFDIEALFDAAETLARIKAIPGDRLAILTNGGGPGFLAVDALIRDGGKPAALSAETKKRLDEELSGCWSFKNPLILSAGVDSAVFEKALGILCADPGVDAALAMHVPTALASAEETAEAVVRASKKTKRAVLTSWLGIDDAKIPNELFAKAGIPAYFTPEKAVRGFLSLVQHRKNQELLMETPDSLPGDFNPDVETARGVVRAALNVNRQILTEPEAADILEAYAIPHADIRLSADMDGADGAVEAAKELGFPVALKIISRDEVRKSQVGGVTLHLDSPEAVFEAAQVMPKRVKAIKPDLVIAGFAVQKMIVKPHAYELLIEAGTDPVFGPVIRFGQGGSLTEIVMDREVSLPPLNMTLARELLSRTKVYRLMAGAGDGGKASIEAVCHILVKVSQLIIDVPEIFELEINPLFVDADGAAALDAQIRVAAAHVENGADQLAIRPYPRELEECSILKDGTKVHLKPIRPEDEPAHWQFLENCSAEDKRFRFFGNIGELPRTEMTKLTQIDYNREMAFVAKGPDPEGAIRTVGVVRAMTDPTNTKAEFAILLRSDYKGKGLGRVLMEKIIRYCKTRGTERITGQALLNNEAMAGLSRAVGFIVEKNYDDEVYEFDMELNPPV